MSVAERFHSETPDAATPSLPGSIDNILRLALNGVTGARPQPARVPSEPDFAEAADLIDRATRTITTLTSQRDDLQRSCVRQEEAFVLQEELFEEKLNLLKAEASEWERRAKIIKAQLQDSENRLSEHQIRIEALTDRAETAEARAAAAEQAAYDAKRQSQLYHEKIMATFGNLT